jgi:stage II sporulation protein GA (sporulation sigma-E factor processing peptidase)
MIIYIDVLFVLNFYVTWLLVKATALFVHERMTTPRLLLSAAAGAVSSLLILIDTPLLPVIKVAAGVALTLIAFGFKTKRRFFVRLAVFLIINCGFAGIMLALWLFAAPAGMIQNHGYIYFDIPLLVLIAATVIAYLLTAFIRRALDSNKTTQQTHDVNLRLYGKELTLKGFADTGNGAKDVFTGLPLIISDKKALSPAMNTDDLMSNAGAHLTPYKAVGFSGLMTVVRPEWVNIDGKPVSALIGVADLSFGENDCVYNPKLLV